MIKTLKIKNFKNFNNEIIFDLSNHRDHSWNDELIREGIVNKAIIYGKNNSGKSNLGAAMMDITTHLSNNFHINRLYNHYANGNSIDNETAFEYDFYIKNKEILYKYHKDKTRKLIDEEFICDGRLLYKYNYNNNLYENNIEAFKDINISQRNRDISMLKYMYSTVNYIDDNNPVKLLFDFVNGMLWFRCLRENEFLGLVQGGESIDEFIVKNGYLQDFEEFLKNMGQDFKLIEMENLGQKIIGVKYDRYVAPFAHVCSTGTSSLLLFYYWMKHTENLSFLYLDEFDAFYHYELSYKIVKYINNDSTYQAILTTHNLNLLDNDISRPDCYYILKNNEIKSLDQLTIKTIREAHNLEKMYLGGEFGR